MIGAYFIFAIVILIVTAYMLIVHSILRSAEEPEDELREQALRKHEPTESHGEPGGGANTPVDQARGARWRNSAIMSRA